MSETITQDTSQEPIRIGYYLGFSAFLLAFGCVAGYILAAMEPAFGESLLTLFQEMVAAEIMDNEPPMLALQLFLNNLQACVIIFIGGALLGVISVAILGFNGIIIGAILQILQKESGAIVLLAAIVPHGLFELPAVIASGALGLMLGRAVRDEFAGTRDAAMEASRLGWIFVWYIIPFVAVAACIEAFITPVVLLMVT